MNETPWFRSIMEDTSQKWNVVSHIWLIVNQCSQLWRLSFTNRSPTWTWLLSDIWNCFPIGLNLVYYVWRLIVIECCSKCVLCIYIILLSKKCLAHSEAPPSASGTHDRHGLIGREFWNHYISTEKYIKPTQFWHVFYHKSLAELWFSSAERDIPHKSVFNTWKLSKKWLLG